ncbi:unnamed protein product [Cylindrotheca closterium]|uniref:Uncharacterized protein n=1 Tax=Cylindrotheca closterium TaxID=2856 RepID=A0AAD2CU37_9STRA|nr:unnamed protein product [Cylindrotheca closterium]
MTLQAWSFPSGVLSVLSAILLLLLSKESDSFLLPALHPQKLNTNHWTLSHNSLTTKTLLQSKDGRISSSSELYYNKAFGNNEDEHQQQQQQQHDMQQELQQQELQQQELQQQQQQENPIPVNEQTRMYLVRKLQHLYYQNETTGLADHDHFGIYQNMPILRSTRVELPGFQSLWNITDPLEIHMFLKVCNSESNHYFGHLHMADEYSSKEIRDFTSSPGMTTFTDQPNGQEEEQSQAEKTKAAEEAFRAHLKKQQEYDFYSRNRYKIGTLMQVSDCHQDETTGHLLVLVQALARFVVVEGSMEQWNWLSLDQFQQQPLSKEEIILRSHGYKPTVQRASVELLPDEEFVQYFTQKAKETADNFDFSLNRDVQGAACAGAIAEASEWRFVEFEPKRIPMPGQLLDPVASMMSQLASVQVQQKVKSTMEEYLSQPPLEMHHGECSLYSTNDDGSSMIEEDHDYHYKDDSSNDNTAVMASLLAQQHVLDVERRVWLELDKLVKNLRLLNPRSNTQIPVPNQVLSLIPTFSDWPEDFGLALYVRQLVRAHGVLARNKYKFSNGFQLVPPDYPPLRRARRLSYILWNVFLEQDTMDVPSGEMQRVLEVHSIASRLEAGLLQLQTINRILQTLIAGS